ncbi:hypothetical protein GCM10023187_24400 [Nibrella viscosa]|uniref:Uncharacterized protein n=1 Tax=Nibrella viscosa TaxID=1084524 RepID=A0ABP8KGA9_9BACT
MKFFVPAVKDETEAEKVYGILRKKVIQQHGYQPGPARLYQLVYEENGQEFTDTVGEPSPFGGERVVAIFQAEDKYLVCTANKGVVKGLPMMVGDWAVVRVVPFEE